MNAHQFATDLTLVDARILKQKGDLFATDLELLKDSPVQAVESTGRIVEVEKVGATGDGRVLIVAKRQSRLADFIQSPAVLIPLGAVIGSAGAVIARVVLG